MCWLIMRESGTHNGEESAIFLMFQQCKGREKEIYPSFFRGAKVEKLDERAKYNYDFLVQFNVKAYFCYAKCENHAVFARKYLQTK